MGTRFTFGEVSVIYKGKKASEKPGTPTGESGRPMISLQKKKGLYRTVGLLFVLILGLLWHAGSFFRDRGRPGNQSQRTDATTSPCRHRRGDHPNNCRRSFRAKPMPPKTVRRPCPQEVLATTTPRRLPAAEPLPAPRAPVSEPPNPWDEKNPREGAPEPARRESGYARAGTSTFAFPAPPQRRTAEAEVKPYPALAAYTHFPFCFPAEKKAERCGRPSD